MAAASAPVTPRVARRRDSLDGRRVAGHHSATRSSSAWSSTALRQNRDLQIGGRADPRVPRGGGRRARRRCSRASPPTGARAPIRWRSDRSRRRRIDADRLTGDLAWELDFWGRDPARRRGRANADLRRAGGGAARGGAVARERRRHRLSAAARAGSGARDRRADVGSRQATLELARQRFEQGLTSELDVRQFEAQVAVPAVDARADRARSRAAGAQAQRAPGRGARRPFRGAVAGRGGERARGSRFASRRAARAAARMCSRRSGRTPRRRRASAWPMRRGCRRFSIIGSLRRPGDRAGQSFRLADATYIRRWSASRSRCSTSGRLANVSAAARARAEQARASYEGRALNALREASDALDGGADGARSGRRASDAGKGAPAGARSRRRSDIRPGWRPTSICSMRSGACSAPSWR